MPIDAGPCRGGQDLLIQPAETARDRQRRRLRQLRAQPGVGFDQAHIILARLDRPNAQDIGTSPQAVAVEHRLGLLRRVGLKTSVGGLVDHTDPFRRNAEARDDLAFCCLGDSDDPVGALDREPLLGRVHGVGGGEVELRIG